MFKRELAVEFEKMLRSTSSLDRSLALNKTLTSDPEPAGVSHKEDCPSPSDTLVMFKVRLCYKSFLLS